MTSRIAADTQIMRGINTAAVLSALRQGDTHSVTALSRSTGLSRQAVTRALANLENLGLAEIAAPEPGSRTFGRPAQTVRFRAEAGYVLGIALAPGELRLALADLSGRLVADRRLSVDAASPLDTLSSSVADLLRISGIRADEIWAATAGAPGIVDPTSGVIKLVPSMESLQGDVVIARLREVLSCPVHLDNDVKLATEAEQWRAPRTLSSLVRVEWGERLGAGIVLNGTILRGASNDAGDLGFLGIPGNEAPITTRPGLGRFENWVGGAELVALALQRAKDVQDEHLTAALTGVEEEARLEVLIDAVRDARPAARHALAEGARRLAAGLADVRALLDPELIVIGGPLARCGEFLLTALRDALSNQILNQPQLELSALGDDAVTMGAIRHCLVDVEQRVFSATAFAESTPAPQTPSPNAPHTKE